MEMRREEPGKLTTVLFGLKMVTGLQNWGNFLGGRWGTEAGSQPTSSPFPRPRFLTRCPERLNICRRTSLQGGEAS